MKYMTTYSIPTENTKAAIDRFMSNSVPLPEGLTLLGRWHCLGTGQGFALVETNNPTLVAKYNIAWSDLLELETTAVLDDAEIAQALT
jgi:hypothetical protein